jgi:hypothetical protein
VFITDPGSIFSSIPDPVSRGKKTPDPGSATVFYTATGVAPSESQFFLSVLNVIFTFLPIKIYFVCSFI